MSPPQLTRHYRRRYLVQTGIDLLAQQGAAVAGVAVAAAKLVKSVKRKYEGEGLTPSAKRARVAVGAAVSYFKRARVGRSRRRGRRYKKRGYKRGYPKRKRSRVRVAHFRA